MSREVDGTVYESVLAVVIDANGLIVHANVPEAQARLLDGYGAKIVSVNAELAKKAARRRQQEQAARARDAIRKAARASKTALESLA